MLKNKIESITNNTIFAVIILVVLFFVLSFSGLTQILGNYKETSELIYAKSLHVNVFQNDNYGFTLEKHTTLQADTEYKLEIITKANIHNITAYDESGRELEYVFNPSDLSILFILQGEYLFIISTEYNSNFIENTFKIIAE